MMLKATREVWHAIFREIEKETGFIPGRTTECDVERMLPQRLAH